MYLRDPAAKVSGISSSKSILSVLRKDKIPKINLGGNRLICIFAARPIKRVVVLRIFSAEIIEIIIQIFLVTKIYVLTFAAPKTGEAEEA